MLTQDEASGVRRRHCAPCAAVCLAYPKNPMLFLSLFSFKLEFLADLLKLDHHFLYINLSLLFYSILNPGLHSVILCTLIDFIVRVVGEL